MVAAKIERFAPRRHGFMVTKERAALPCGCCVYVGLRTDNHEATTGAQACSPYHGLVMEHFNQLLLESLQVPTKRLLVEVCRSLLTQAAKGAGL